MPCQVREAISMLKNKYMKEVDTYWNKLATLSDVELFSLSQEEITGERHQHIWGNTLHGRFGACLQCRNNHVGIWICNMMICRDEDKETLKNIFQYIEYRGVNIWMILWFLIHLILSWMSQWHLINQREGMKALWKTIHVYNGSDWEEGEGNSPIEDWCWSYKATSFIIYFLVKSMVS